MARVSVLRPVLVLSLLAPFAGCEPAKPPKPPRQPTRGTVTYNGKPPNGAVIHFWPLPVEGVDWQTVKPAARVGPDGSFQINSYEPADGAVVGDYAVTLLWTGENPDVPPRPDFFKGRYSDPKNPAAKVTIKEGDNVLPPIELKGPPVNANDGWVDPVTGEKS